MTAWSFQENSKRRRIEGEDLLKQECKEQDSENSERGSEKDGSQKSPSDACVRKLYRSFTPLSAKLLPGIQLEARQNRPWLNVEKSRLPDAGLGVIALRPFRTGAILCQFEGSLLPGLQSNNAKSKAQQDCADGGGAPQIADRRHGFREGAEEVEIAVLTAGEHIRQKRPIADVGVGCMLNHGWVLKLRGKGFAKLVPGSSKALKKVSMQSSY
eukprot:symbB.v1.2.016337.t1/scaffold1222.1/size194531/11